MHEYKCREAVQRSWSDPTQKGAGLWNQGSELQEDEMRGLGGLDEVDP